MQSASGRHVIELVHENRGVTDIPKWAISRSMKLASLPLGAAGRGAIGIGKRIGGRPAEMVATEIQTRTAEQLFKVLGELKGGAMKFGQALSVFEAALPEDLAAPYRAALTKLQDAAPPMPASAVHGVLAEGLGADWREQFTEWNDKPAAAASIGQVHRAVWHDGREVAVKLQYPGAGPALLSDLNQLARFARLFSIINPGLDVKPLIKELKERVSEELDYSIEGNTLTYKWTNVIPGFDMPVRVTLADSGYAVIHPTTSPRTAQLALTDPATFSVDPNFYVIAHRDEKR